MNLKATLVASLMLASTALTPVLAQNSDNPQGSGSAAGSQFGGQGGTTGKRMRKMDPQRLAKIKERMMKRFDTNGDGTLDETERAQMQAARKNRRAHGRKHRGGRKNQNSAGDSSSNNSGMLPGGTPGNSGNQ